MFFLSFSAVGGAAIMTNTPFIKVSGCTKKKHLFFSSCTLVISTNQYFLPFAKPFVHSFYLDNMT